MCRESSCGQFTFQFQEYFWRLRDFISLQTNQNSKALYMNSNEAVVSLIIFWFHGQPAKWVQNFALFIVLRVPLVYFKIVYFKTKSVCFWSGSELGINYWALVCDHDWPAENPNAPRLCCFGVEVLMYNVYNCHLRGSEIPKRVSPHIGRTDGARCRFQESLLRWLEPGQLSSEPLSPS